LAAEGADIRDEGTLSFFGGLGLTSLLATNRGTVDAPTMGEQMKAQTTGAR
jgi:hypothetical protein